MEMSTSALNRPKRKAYEIDYDSLSVTDVEKTMAKEAEYISGMFQVDVSYPSLLHRLVVLATSGSSSYTPFILNLTMPESRCFWRYL